MPRTNWLLLAAVAGFPCSCRRVRWPGSCCLWRTGWLWRPRRSAPRRSVGRVSAGRSPIRRRRRRSRSAPPPGCGRPRARAALVQEHAHDPRRGARRGGPRLRLLTVVPSAGLMRVGDGVWVTLPSESKEAYAKLTAGLTPRPARTLPSVGEAPAVARVDSRLGPERGHPGAGERRLERLDRRAGRRRASGAHGGVAAQYPPPPRVDAASGARGTRSSVTNRPRPVVLAAASDEQEQRGRERRHGDAATALRQTRHSPDSCESESAADSRRAVSGLPLSPSAGCRSTRTAGRRSARPACPSSRRRRTCRRSRTRPGRSCRRGLRPPACR